MTAPEHKKRKLESTDDARTLAGEDPQLRRILTSPDFSRAKCLVCSSSPLRTHARAARTRTTVVPSGLQHLDLCIKSWAWLCMALHSSTRKKNTKLETTQVSSRLRSEGLLLSRFGTCWVHVAESDPQSSRFRAVSSTSGFFASKRLLQSLALCWPVTEAYHIFPASSQQQLCGRYCGRGNAIKRFRFAGPFL